MHSILIIYDTYLHKSGSSSGFDLEVLLTSKKTRSKQMQYQSLTRVTSSTKNWREQLPWLQASAKREVRKTEYLPSIPKDFRRKITLVKLRSLKRL